MGLCGQCAWCEDGMYCRKTHKDVPYFGEKSCYTTQDEFRLLFAQEVTKIEQDTNKLNQDTKKMAENTNIKTKVCKDCGRELPIDQFQKQFKSSDGYMHICKECKSKRVAQGMENKIKEDHNKKDKELKDKLGKMGEADGVEEKGILVSGVELIKDLDADKAFPAFPPTQDKYDRLQVYTAYELVDHLRFLGWDVTCTRTIKL